MHTSVQSLQRVNNIWKIVGFVRESGTERLAVFDALQS